MENKQMTEDAKNIIQNEKYQDASQLSELIGDAEQVALRLVEVLNRAKNRSDKVKENFIT